MEINKITLGDSLELIKTLPDKSIDLILTDPPYYKAIERDGFNNFRITRNEKGERIVLKDLYNDDFKWDAQWQSLEEFCKWVELYAIEFNRVLKDTGSFYWFGDECNIAHCQVVFDKYFDIINNIVWYKPNGIFNRIKYTTKFANTNERILFYEKRRTNYQKQHYPRTFNILNEDKNQNIITQNSPSSTKENTLIIHPTQKPMQLISYLLQKSSNEGDVVLDCFGGSGVTAVVSKMNNRKFYVIEKDKTYYEKSVIRLNSINENLI
jgi:DNA modification methylase